MVFFGGVFFFFFGYVFFFKKYLFLAELGLQDFLQLWQDTGYSLVVVRGLLVAVASLVAEYGLCDTGA